MVDVSEEYRSEKMPLSTGRLTFLCLALSLLVLGAYANHFDNGFHFDDYHTVSGNPSNRDLHNIPQFFTDRTLFSTLPDHQNWRPVTSVSLAVDYWLGKGLKPFYFQLSTFLWFLVQVILMWFLFQRIMDLSDPHPSNLWTALAAAACYGLHPANAETVNYVVQRADLFCALGAVASLLWFISKPAQRSRGFYLLPAAAAYFAKAPALIFPLILMAYVFLFELDANPRRWREALRATAPAIAVAIVAAILNARMTPPSYIAGASSDSLYRLTQPWVALHYFKSFFLPTELSADTDWGYVSDPLATDAVAGYVFVLGLLVVAWRTARSREARPVAFGIIWFFLAQLPTALMPLAEVTNDHRMFFPFVGLALAVFWGLRLLLFRQTLRLTTNGRVVRGAILALAVVLVAAAAGTRSRNEVWHSDEALWRDVTLKSPRNGRGLMNYGLIFMERGDYTTALSYFDRALAFTPNYWSLEVNLAIANGGLNADAEAERHFERAMMLAPGLADPLFYYARWLSTKGRGAEAIIRLEMAVRINRLNFDARHLLMQLYAGKRDVPALERLAQETLQLAPDDEIAKRILANSGNPEQAAMAAIVPVVGKPTPETFLDLSLREYQAGRFEESIAAAKKALELRPDYAEAYNNISAASNAMGKWDDGIQAATEAVRIKPDYQLAKNNMLWAIEKKKSAAK